MEFFTTVSILITMSAAFAYFNGRFFKLPMSIGLMLMAILTSGLFLLLAQFIPDWTMGVCHKVSEINFTTVLLDVMLSFLLFAGALHVNSKDLIKERRSVLFFATISVLISTALVGVLSYFLLGAIGFQIPFIYCLLFGALISPTDPIAVLAILKTANAPKSLETKIAGESLFNDGIGVVVFLSILNIANVGLEHFSFEEILHHFAVEAVGGILFGFALGYLGYYLVKTCGDPKIEILITLAVAAGGYTLAHEIGTSGPLAMVVAGLIIGNRVRTSDLSLHQKEMLDTFWEILDEMLNALLFVLMGIELLVLEFEPGFLLAGIVGIIIVLFSRTISVLVPVLGSRSNGNSMNTLKVLVWGGLRGGISVALALSLSEDLVYRDILVFITYVIVLFSILVQGLTIKPLIQSSNKHA